MSKFQKAVKSVARLKIALTGVSGAGKTYSALRLAKGLGGRTALIDTENGSASLYADKFDFEVLELSPPYTTEKYIDALSEAQKEKFDIVIIDSMSHQWAGEGGLLNRKEQMDARGGNSYTNWAKMTPEHEKFKSAITQATCHVIGTMRSKQDYALDVNDKGKVAPKKIGLAPIQRDGMEYEFTIVFDIGNNNEAVASKDRTDLFRGAIFKISEETGEKLNGWLTGANQKIKYITDEQRSTIWVRIKNDLKFSDDEAKAYIVKMSGKQASKDLTDDDYVAIMMDLDDKTLGLLK